MIKIIAGNNNNKYVNIEWRSSVVHIMILPFLGHVKGPARYDNSLSVSRTHFNNYVILPIGFQ